MNLGQLLSNQLCTSPVLYRPTPIHPVIQSNNSYYRAAESTDLPLDLSQSSTVAHDTPQQPSFLPTCTNPNINSNWIAIKFGASATGPNRMSYPREFKLMVINYYYANGQNKYRTCKEFQITKSMLNGWLQKVDKIRQSRPGSLKSGRSGRKPQFPDIEKQLFALYSTHLGSGQKVGNRWIRETAKNLAQQQCSKQQLGGMCQFSERWLSNFKKRYHINLNRDWSSSASSSFGSGESIGSASSTTGDCGRRSPEKNEEGIDEGNNISDTDDYRSDSESVTSENSERTVNSEQYQCSSITNDQKQVNEILNKPGQLPIHAFYERFPWLCRRNNAGTEPGRRGRKVQFPDVEKVLFERLRKRQSNGDRISNRWLQEQARQLATQLCPNVLEEATKSARCLFSEHWLHNFKKRYGVSLKQSNSYSFKSNSSFDNNENNGNPNQNNSNDSGIANNSDDFNHSTNDTYRTDNRNDSLHESIESLRSNESPMTSVQQIKSHVETKTKYELRSTMELSDSSTSLPTIQTNTNNLSDIINLQNWFISHSYSSTTPSFTPVNTQSSPIIVWHQTNSA